MGGSHGSVGTLASDTDLSRAENTECYVGQRMMPWFSGLEAFLVTRVELIDCDMKRTLEATAFA